MDENDITVAIDGSLYKHHPRMKSWLEHIIAERAPDKLVTKILKYFDSFICISFDLLQFRLLLAEDGSGKGAGLATAIALRLRARE